MEEEAAQDYVTAAEEEELVPETPAIAPVDQEYAPSSAAAEEADKLRARILELEGEVAKSRQFQAPVSKAPAMAKFGKTPGLFQPQRTPAELDPADLQKLHQLAGAPPPRTGQHEKRRVTPLPVATQEPDALFAEVEKEVLEAGLADANLPNPGQADPLTRLLMVQMQQSSGCAVRFGQRKRKLLQRSKGLCSSRCIPESSGRHGVGSNYSEKECIGGARHGTITRRQFSDAALHRASNSFERASSPLSCGDFSCRRLGSGIRSGQQSNARVSWSSSDVRGAGGIGPREAPIGVASHGAPRAQSSCAFQLQEETRPETIQQISQSSLGKCQFGIPQRSGFLC